jgi:hypothetical protein
MDSFLTHHGKGLTKELTDIVQYHLSLGYRWGFLISAFGFLEVAQ